MPQTHTTPRCSLRPLSLSDAPTIARLVGDLDVSRWLTRVPHPYSVADGESFVTDNRENRFVRAVERGGELIGCVSIEDELGYWYGKPFWGQGIATEAARALVTEYFETETQDIRSGHILGNHASRRVLQKLGFQDQEIQDAPCVALGHTVRVQKMVLARADWRPA